MICTARIRAALAAISFLVTGLALGSCATPERDEAPAARQLRVLTYNIHHGQGNGAAFDFVPDSEQYQDLARFWDDSGRLLGQEAPTFGAAPRRSP